MPYLLTVLALMMVQAILAACGGEAAEGERGREPAERPPATEAAGLTPGPDPTTIPEREPTADATPIRQQAPTVAPTPAPMLASTTTPEPAPTVAPTPAPTLTDREILEVSYHATDGPNWANHENWLSDKPLGEWFGVTTDSAGNVTELVLSGNGLQGELSPELAGLRSLEVLRLYRNLLTGEIPPELGKLSSLRALILAATKSDSSGLSGEIPPELGALSNLVELNLGNNQLTGEIPPQLGSLGNLQILFLFGNQLSGEIPPDLGGLSKLQRLGLYENRLSGHIPPELGDLANLTYLGLHRNQLSGKYTAAACQFEQPGHSCSLCQPPRWRDPRRAGIPR